jgi:hypothetical protein
MNKTWMGVQGNNAPSSEKKLDRVFAYFDHFEIKNKKKSCFLLLTLGFNMVFYCN